MEPSFLFLRKQKERRRGEYVAETDASGFWSRITDLEKGRKKFVA